MPPLPRLAAWLLRITVPECWAGSVTDDMESDWHASLRQGDRRLFAAIWITIHAARVAARFAVEGCARAVDATRRDAREAARALARRPRFALATVTTIALGAGVNTAAFAVVDRVVLRPLAYADPDRLVEVRGRRGPAGESERTVSSVDFESWRSGLAAMADLAAYAVETVHIRTGADSIPASISAAFVTPNLFAVIGVSPVVGRGFAANDGRIGEPGAAMVARHVWRARFGADPDPVGRAIEVGGQLYTVVGLAPEGVEFPPGVGIWLARETAAARFRDLRIEFASLAVVGRLRAIGSVDQAIREVEDRGTAIARELGRDLAPVAVSLHDALIGPSGEALRLGWAAVAFVFLVACANAASLLLARTASRHHELAVRASLGASRVALVRHVVVEGALLASIGSVLGLAIAAGLIDLFARTQPGGIPRLAGVALSGPSLAFAGVLALVAAAMLSALPALRVRGFHPPRLTTDGHRAIAGFGGHHRSGGPVVAIQLALCVVLLVAAGVTGWGVLRQLLRDPGFDAAGLLVVSVRPDAVRARQASSAAIYGPLLERIAALDGVTAVAMTDHLPPMAAGQLAPVALEGERLGADEAGALVRTVGVTAGYFSAMRIPLVAGRWLTDAEVARGASVVVVDTRVAARAAGRDALGRRLILHGRVFDIVGIAADARQGRLDQPPGPTIYRPLHSGTYATGGMTFLTDLHIVVRTKATPADLAAAVSTTIGAPPRVVDATGVTTLVDRLWASLAGPRFHATLFGLFAVLGALLAAFGVYGLVSYVVQLSAREIGVRVALGASIRNVVALVLRRGLGHALLGAGAGLVVAPAVAGVVASRLEGVAQASVGVYAGVTVTLLMVVASACAVPAWRATKIDPVLTLRCD